MIYRPTIFNCTFPRSRPTSKWEVRSALKVDGEPGYYVAFSYAACKEVPITASGHVAASLAVGSWASGDEWPCLLQLQSFPRWAFSGAEHYVQGDLGWDIAPLCCGELLLQVLNSLKYVHVIFVDFWIPPLYNLAQIWNPHRWNSWIKDNQGRMPEILSWSPLSSICGGRPLASTALCAQTLH